MSILDFFEKSRIVVGPVEFSGFSAASISLVICFLLLRFGFSSIPSYLKRFTVQKGEEGAGKKTIEPGE